MKKRLAAVLMSLALGVTMTASLGAPALASEFDLLDDGGLTSGEDDLPQTSYDEDELTSPTLSAGGEGLFLEDEISPDRDVTEEMEERDPAMVGKALAGTWTYQDGAFSYVDEKGAPWTVDQLRKGKADDGLGYFEINGAYYVLGEDGVPATGLITLNGFRYYLQPDSEIPGQMFLGGWKNLSDDKGTRWIYFQKENTGKNRGQAVDHTGNFVSAITPISTTTRFLMDKDGYLLRNAHVVLENGVTWVGSRDNGTLNKARLAAYDGVRYYFDAAGSQVKWANGFYLLPGLGTYYYFGSTPGAVEEIRGYNCVVDTNDSYIGWFYYDEAGDPVRFRFFDERYFVDLGKSVGGFRDLGNQGAYFFATSSRNALKGQFYRNTLIRSKGKYYYAQADGRLLKEGFVTIDGNRYTFKNYTLQMNVLDWINGTYGYIDASGVFHTGWCISSNENNKVMYVDPSGNGFYRNTNVVIDGLRYYFDENGFRINDLTNIYTGPYYVRVDRVNGVMTVYDSTRTVPVKSIRVSVGTAYTPTPTGTYSLRSYARWVSLMGPSWGQYGTHVVGAGQGGIFVHSIACTYANSYNVPAGAYNMLGNPASHGCIRVCVADAKWVYEHCNGATITIFDGSYNHNEALKGPLGRRALVPMTGNYDPTDPAV